MYVVVARGWPWRRHNEHTYQHPHGRGAVLIDRDNNPKWKHARIEDVTEADVAAHFAPVDNDLVL